MDAGANRADEKVDRDVAFSRARAGKIAPRGTRVLDVKKAIRLLCGPADYRVAPRAPKPTTGLVEQQYWFMKARPRGSIDS